MLNFVRDLTPNKWNGVKCYNDFCLGSQSCITTKKTKQKQKQKKSKKQKQKKKKKLQKSFNSCDPQLDPTSHFSGLGDKIGFCPFQAK